MFLISDWHYDKHHILEESVEPLACSLFRQEYVHMVWAGADTQSDYQGPYECQGRVLTCCLFKNSCSTSLVCYDFHLRNISTRSSFKLIRHAVNNVHCYREMQIKQLTESVCSSCFRTLFKIELTQDNELMHRGKVSCFKPE